MAGVCSSGANLNNFQVTDLASIGQTDELRSARRAGRREDPATKMSPPALDPFLHGMARSARFGVRPVAPEPLPRVDGLLAGAAQVDITPPPGLPKAGYSANAHDGSGFRTRLRATVVHLRHGTTSLALVQCDLLGGSSVVQHLVAEAVAGRTDIPLAGLAVGATHTHAGPGQFLGTDFYNRFASNRSGFDPDYTAFLVDRIAGAVSQAHDRRRPAVAAFGEREVWGLTRNRSLAAHVRNTSVPDTRTSAERKFFAVNPALHLLRVDTLDDEGRPRPLSAHVIFSVHGTGVPMTADEYNADLWAYLTGQLAHEVDERTGHRPLVGAMEGTHADVAPALRPGTAGHLEAGRLGRSMGHQAALLHHDLATELTADLPLGVALRELDLDLDDHRRADGVEIPRRPAVGAALVAGAHENLTPVIHRVPPFRAGMPKPFGAAADQGRKWVLGSRRLQPVVLPLRGFPSVIPVHLLRIGPTVVVGVPFEVTVEAGRRISASVAAAFTSGGEHAPADGGVHQVVVSSVMNEYFGYVATPEEYDRQHYEGAHTLFGPRFAPYLANQAGVLATELAARGGTGTVHAARPERSWRLKVVPHLHRARGGAGSVSRSGSSSASVAPPSPRPVAHPRFVDPTATHDGFWELEWEDVPPGALDWSAPLVAVQVATTDGWTVARSRDGFPADDQGWQLQVRSVGPSGATGRWRYRVRWWEPFVEGARTYRFAFAANADRPAAASTPFP